MPMMTQIHHHNVAAFPFSGHPSPAPSPAKRNHPRLLSFLLRTLIMVLIIALFFLFLGVAAIVFAHLCLASQTLRRRRSRHRHVTATATSRGGRLGYSVDELKGMLPKRRVREEEMMMCAICLDDLVEAEWCGSLKECGHCFHYGCVERWLIRVPSCPVCRAEVVLDDDADRDRVCVSRGDSDDLAQLWDVFR